MSPLIFLTALSQLVNPSVIAAKPVSQEVPAVISNQPASTKQLLQQGVKFYQTQRFDSAAKLFKQASKSFQASGDRLNQASALNYLSLTYQQLGELSQAEQAIANSLELLKNKKGSKESLSIRAQALNTKGKLQLSQGKPQEALTSWEKATANYSKIKDEAGVIGSKLNQIQALQALGLYNQAKKILESDVKLLLDNQPNSVLKAKGLLSLGNALRVVGDLDKSQAILKESLTVAQKLQSKETEAEVLLSLGNTAQTEQKTKEALDYYQQAATISNKTTQLQAKLNQLPLLVEKKQWSEAESLSQQIQSKLGDIPPNRFSVNARINFANSLKKIARNQTSNTKIQTEKTAAQIVATAIKQAENLKDSRAQAYALGTLGGLYEQTEQWSEAQKLTEQALNIAEGIQAPDIAYRWQWQLGRILKAQNQKEGAKAAYNNAIGELKLLRNDLASVNRDVQFSFREQVEPVYRQYVSLLLQDKQPTQDDLKQARNVLESLQLAELDNFFRRACIDTQPVQLNEIDKTAGVVYPVILPDRLEIIVSLPNQSQNQSLRRYKINISEKELEKTIIGLRSTIQNPGPGVSQGFYTDEYLTSSQKLYDLLIRPIESELQNNKVENLVFVLDGSLRNIPMAALHDGEKFLIEKEYNLAVSPGLQLLPPKQALNQEKLSAVIGGLGKVNEENPNTGNFEDLKYVSKELNQIEEQTQINAEKKFLDSNFTTQQIKQALKSSPASIIHLATHGQFRANAEETFILTWDNKISVNELRSVLNSSSTARETNQRNALELLILSACQTAAGDSRTALGLAGVAIQSGARSTLASLWLVEDKSTSELMNKFYDNLVNKKMTKAEALRQAQISMAKDYAHPYFWAPFILIGNWQ
ncbi:MAG: CHAT domain-containing protein [Cyanobacteria bacterium J06643_5]